MANTTSGTSTFEKGFSIADIVEESYERIGIQGVSGYQLKVLDVFKYNVSRMYNRGLHIGKLQTIYYISKRKSRIYYV